MKCRSLIFIILSFCFVSPSYAIFFAGELTTSDPLAQDPGWGDFYYDMYYVAVDTPMLVEIFMVPTDPILPWLGYWDGDFTPTPDYDTPPPEAYRTPVNVGDQLYLSFDALPGIEYQIMAATFEYNPTDLGAYNFYITEPGRTDLGLFASTSPGVLPQEVPSPQSGIIFVLGLFALAFVNKFSRFRQPLLIGC